MFARLRVCRSACLSSCPSCLFLCRLLAFTFRSAPVCVACRSALCPQPPDCILPFALCRGPVLGCSFWARAGTQLYDSCLSWCVSCRCLASQPFPYLLDSCALCEQDDLGSIITSSHTHHWFVMVPCYHMFMRGLGCMCLRPCWGSLLYMAHTCF